MSNEAAKTSSQRNAARDSLFLSTDIIVASCAHPITVRVRNLSSGGMMIDGHEAFEDGAEISTDLRGIGPVTGRIAWIMAGRAGVSFDRNVDPRKARTPIGQAPVKPLGRPVTDASSRPGLKVR